MVMHTRAQRAADEGNYDHAKTRGALAHGERSWGVGVTGPEGLQRTLWLWARLLEVCPER